MAGPWEQFGGAQSAPPAAGPKTTAEGYPYYDQGGGSAEQPGGEGPWSAFKPTGAPSTPAAEAPPPEPLPQPFIDRMAQGEALKQSFDEMAAKPYSQRLKEWTASEMKAGNYPGVALGTASAFVAGIPEMIASGAKLAGDALTGTVVTGAGLRKSDFSDDPDAPEPLDALIARSQDMAMTGGVRESAAPRVTLEGQAPLVFTNDGRVARPFSDPDGTMRAHVVGAPPTPVDFKTAAQVLGSPDAEANLKQLWQEHGIHPAEAVHDAQSDAFLKHDLTARPSERGIPKQVRAGPFSIETTPISGKNLWHETSGENASQIIQDDLTNSVDRARTSNIFVADNPDIAIGQSGSGVRIEFDGDFVSAQEHKKPGTGDLTGREYQTNAIGNNAIKSVEVAPGAKLNLSPAWKARFEHEFKPTELEDGTIRWTRQPAAEGKPASLGAAASTEPPLVSPAVQPLPPSGKLMGAVRDNIDGMIGLARNLQFMVDPMAAGSNAAMVVAKDTISSIRRIDWDNARLDEYLMKQFKPEQRARMFNAMDEESVALQTGESREHQGLATLEPGERAIVEKFDADQQHTWQQMRDLGMIEGEGLPMHAPRFLINMAKATDKDAALSLNTIGTNVRVKTGTMMHRKYLTVEDTESAAKAKFGAQTEVARDIRVLPVATARQQKAVIYRTMINKIEEIGRSAGDQTVIEGAPPEGSQYGWFTLDHPAFKTWRPKFERLPNGDPAIEGNMIKTVKDAEGNVIFEQSPIYVRNDFEGPLRSIMDEAPSKHPLAKGAMTGYQALMALKGKAMTVILNSPLIHNAVVWGKVAPSAPGEWLGFRLYWKGNAIKNDPVRAGQLIERGLAPIGHRGSFQDITSMMEEPSLTAGRSTFSKVLAFGPGLIDDAYGQSIKRAIDTAGDVYHGTLLWDRVADVQFGVAAHLSDKLVDLGTERVVADRIGAHFANTIVGSMPKEAMSNAARAFLNTTLFSRSFTVGNLQVGKMAAFGLPKPIMAQIERDLGTVPPEADTFLKQLGRRRAMGQTARTAVAIIAVDYAMSKIINSLLQNAINVTVNDSSVSQETREYARRLQTEYDKVKTDPTELLHPLNLVDRLTPMGANEPSKENRIFIGYDKDGTAIYGRNPVGKYPEELVDWATSPKDTLKRKLSPMVGGVLDIMANDKGFGRKIYDPTAMGYIERGKAVFNAMEYLVEKHLPMQQVTGAWDLLRGDGDQKVNAMRTLGPAAGFTVSQGAPGGMAKGELYAEKDSYKAKFDIEWPSIRKQIKRGDLPGARAAMEELRVTPRDQRSLIRAAQYPGRISGAAMRDFLYRATPEARARMESRRQTGPLAPEQ